MELGELWCFRVVKLRFSSARSGWGTGEVLVAVRCVHVGGGFLSEFVWVVLAY